MNITLEELELKLDHIGINLTDIAEARACVGKMESLFGLVENLAKDCVSASFTGTEIEWMKGAGPGKNGHLAISTNDLPKARTYFEAQGIVFDENTIKWLPDGRMLVIYALDDIGGYAWHLMQR